MNRVQVSALSVLSPYKKMLLSTRTLGYNRVFMENNCHSSVGESWTPFSPASLTWAFHMQTIPPLYTQI